MPTFHLTNQQSNECKTAPVFFRVDSPPFSFCLSLREDFSTPVLQFFKIKGGGFFLCSYTNNRKLVCGVSLLIQQQYISCKHRYFHNKFKTQNKDWKNRVKIALPIEVIFLSSNADI
jgi:hypothetical protein